MEVDIVRYYYEIWSHMLHLGHLVIGIFLISLLKDMLYLMIVTTILCSSVLICILFYHT
jgi:hypothetical protein